METVNIRYLGLAPDTQTYDQQDVNLITTSNITPSFGAQGDYIEYFIRDLNGTIIAQNYNATNYTPGTSNNPTAGTYTTIELDPEQDAKANGIDRGSVTIKYNFYKQLFNSAAYQKFWIKEISPSRTEIKVARQDLSNTALLNAFNAFNAGITTSNYYPDFLLNFGQDIEIIAINAVYTQEGDNSYIIFKLYNPLPLDYDLRSQFWVVQKVADSVEFEVTINIETVAVVNTNRLRGPNYKVAINQRQNQTTPYYNYTNLFSTLVTSSYQQLQSWFDDKAISINVDYSNFDNYIHFSSATERLLNFEYKVRMIEALNADIAAGNAVTNVPTNIVTTANAALQEKIDSIITKFDGYEYYLYFSSESTAWPKQNNTQPYQLYSATSSVALDWLGDVNTPPTTGKLSMLYSASLYDNQNKDNLQYSMPAYIQEDGNNQPYMTFLNMIGQHFDNIWIYYKDVSNRYSAENNPNVGISMDVVADALRGFGIQLYTNSNISDNIYYSMLGLNDTGSTLPITSSQYAQLSLANSNLTPLPGNEWLSASIYLPPFGNENLNEYVTTFLTPSTGVTASFGVIPPMQLEKEYYKRLYHNLAYLLKTRGTQRGVKALIACYGIPNSILTVNEFGGGDIFAAPELQQIQNQKVFTGSTQQINSTLLSPYTTLQYYQNNLERGSIDIEVGFSPADSINADITSSLGNFNIMQYIGDPNLQYSSSYTPLDTLSNNYFDANYHSRYNVWDFIRIIKFYNNSLFKSIKDYVPARASVSSAIIVKPHILERNKYARHEPTITRPEHSQSIDTAFITASDAPGITISTAYNSVAYFASGTVVINNSYHWEPYTGQFSGSVIDPTTGYFPQIEQSNITAPWTSSVAGATVMYTTYSLNYLYQNVSSSVKSLRYLDLDFSSDPNVPVNYGLITQSINNYPASLNNPYAPWAELQDYNYYLRRSILPRYSGSKSTSLYYNVYTGATGSWAGDTSYGNNPSIDYNTFKLGWVKTIPTESLNFYEKTIINLKYLVDPDQNITELSANNDNLVEVQNTFKSGTPVKVSVTDVQFPSNQTTLDGTKTIYRGGYRFDPIIYRESNEPLTFEFNDPVSSSVEYIGAKLRTETYHQYDAINAVYIFNQNAGIRAVPTTNSSTTAGQTQYVYYKDGTIQSPDPMSYKPAISQNIWPNTNNPKTDFTTGGTAVRVTTPKVYAFDLVKFTEVVTNTEPSAGTVNALPAANYIYKVPRSSTYNIKLQIPFAFAGSDRSNQAQPAGFKIVALVETSNTPGDDTSWVAATDLNGDIVATEYSRTFSNSPHIGGTTNNNLLTVNFNSQSTSAVFVAQCSLNQDVQLILDQYVRVTFYIIDISDIFGAATNGLGYFRFWLNLPTYGPFLPPTRDTDKASFQINDINTAYDVYTYTSSYDDTQGPFFTTSSLYPNAIQINPTANNIFDSASIFQPTFPANKYYTPVIDYTNIQKYDLIRFTKFATPNPTYYTVTDVTTLTRPAITVTGNFVNFSVPGSNIIYNYFQYAFDPNNPYIFYPGDVLTITGTNGGINNNTNVTVTRFRPQLTTPTYGIIYVYFNTTVINQGNTPATFTFANNNSRLVFLDRNLATTTSPVNASSFAVLRPKPDETTVIVDFRKQPGEVAQTLLIPNNASKLLKDNVGTIFQSLNVPLG